MKSLYGRDYIGIRPQVPGKRLKLITHLFLAAVIRGLGRVGHPSDMFLLDEIKMKQDPFANWLPDRRYQILSKHVMGLIDESRAAISARNN